MRPSEEELERLPDAVADPAAAEPSRGPLPRWTRLMVAVGIAGLVVGAGYLFSRSAFFRVDHIRVTGASHLTPARVIRESGLSQQTNVLYMDATAAELRLERDPWIGSASVRRSLPGTITIGIRERTAIAAVQDGDSFDFLAADGSVLGARAAAGRLPVIVFPLTSTDRSPVGPTSALAALDPSVRLRVSTVSVDSVGAITLELRPDSSVLLGTPTQLEAKAEALTAMLTWAAENRTHLAFIDVRFPGAPSARPTDAGRVGR